MHRLPNQTAVFSFITMAMLSVIVLLADLPDSDLSAVSSGKLAIPLALLGLALILVVWRFYSHRWRRLVPVRSLWLASLGVFGVVQIGVAYAPLSDAELTQRNFYGVVQVLKEKEAGTGAAVLSLRHGRILHGFQYLEGAKRHEPGAYYHPRSGIGLAILQHPRRQTGRTMHIGVIGLGAGMLAAYGRAGDQLRFYEINPQVIQLAAAPQAPFTYVRETKATVTLVTGDARLALEAELARREPQAFDVLAVDAFSSDSIPVHLLTREAMQLYLAHVAADGLLAIHVSNRYLDLVPIVWRIARDLNLTAAVIESDGDNPSWHSIWVLLARDARTLGTADIAAASNRQLPPAAPLWRDDYSNLFQAMHYSAQPMNNPLDEL